MKKYFSILNSLNKTTMGNLPQVKNVIHNCDVIEDQNFIDKFPFKEIEINPILSNVILYSKSKQTDLIHTSSVGFSYGSILISDKLKKILEKFNHFGVQFFPTHLIHKEKKIENYWQSHIYDIPYDFIDFKKTDLLIKDRDENRKPIQSILSKVGKLEFFNMIQSIKYPKMLYMKNIVFNEEMNFDYFFLRNFEGSNQGIVSEKLKKEIEINNISGIEFKPIEVSLNDWFGYNGLREKLYGRVPQMRSDNSIRN